MRITHARHELIKDLIFITCGGAAALLLSYTGLIDTLVHLIGRGEAASFVAGLFFTSVFTIAPASVALGSIALTTDGHTVALWGSLGAVCGDLVLFYFIRDRFSRDIMNAFGKSFTKHFARSFHVGFFKWISPLVGALIIASPLPDELGITLLGFSRVSPLALICVSFLGNALGIYAIVWFGSVFSI